MANNFVPENELDLQTMTIIPDYGDLSEELKKTLNEKSNHTTEKKFEWEKLELFKSGFRLGNLSGTEQTVAEENLRLALECFRLGLIESGFSFYNDVVVTLELSQSKKGFRSTMMNSIHQFTNTDNSNKRGVFGNTKED